MLARIPDPLLASHPHRSMQPPYRVRKGQAAPNGYIRDHLLGIPLPQQRLIGLRMPQRPHHHLRRQRRRTRVHLRGRKTLLRLLPPHRQHAPYRTWSSSEISISRIFARMSEMDTVNLQRAARRGQVSTARKTNCPTLEITSNPHRKRITKRKK